MVATYATHPMNHIIKGNEEKGYKRTRTVALPSERETERLQKVTPVVGSELTTEGAGKAFVVTWSPLSFRSGGQLSLQAAAGTEAGGGTDAVTTTAAAATCACCGMDEECTPRYVARVAAQFGGACGCAACAPSPSRTRPPGAASGSTPPGARMPSSSSAPDLAAPPPRSSGPCSSWSRRW